MASFIAPLIGGLAGLFGGGNQQKTQTNGTITNNGSSSSSTSPNFSPLQQALISQFTKGASDLYNSSADLSGYAASGAKTINKNSALSNNVLRNTLAAHGLSYSPAATTSLTQSELGRSGQISDFMNNLPLLQRQLQSSSLSQLMQAFSAIPTGQSSTGTTNSTQEQHGTNLVSGNPTAGAISGVGAGLLGPNSSGTGSNLGDIMNIFFPKSANQQPGWNGSAPAAPPGMSPFSGWGG